MLFARAAVLALPGDDAHADQVDRQPLRGLPVQRRPLRVERHGDADQHVADARRDAELPEHLEARPVDEQVGQEERERRETRRRPASGTAAAPRDLPAEGAQRQRRPGVHQHARGGDQADQGVPARERQQEQQAGQEREDQAEPRDAVPVDLLEELRVVAVTGQAVADARGRGQVDQPGAERGDERVDAQDDGQPGQPDQAREPGERPDRDGARARDARPALGAADQAVRDRADEHELQHEVDRRCRCRMASDDRQRQVPLRVLDLPGELVGLLEAEVGEDDARGRDARRTGP